MTIYLIILTIGLYVVLVILASLGFRHGQLSFFELKRRSDMDDPDAKADLKREKIIGNIVAIQKVTVSIVLVVTTIICVVVFGWFIGIVVAILIAISYNSVANLRLFQSRSNSYSKRAEKFITKLINKYPIITKLIKNKQNDDCSDGRKIGSSQELQHIVDKSENILTADQKSLITHGLVFGGQLVGSIMTTRDKIKTISKSEFLGPLVLDDLHKIGHSRLPVINGDLDHIVGILKVDSLLALDIKRSMTAGKAMDPKVYYLRDDQTLQQALEAFLHTHCHIFIIVNKSKETVGILTMSDVFKALFGRDLPKEFDSYESLRAVASREN